MKPVLLLPILLLAGCASTKPTMADRFPSSSSMKTSSRHIPLYEQAKEDFSLLRNGSRPANARMISQIYDGGSIFYKGEGYNITSWHRLSKKDGMQGLWVGPEIVFKAPISRVGRISYSEATFKPHQ